VIDTQSVKTATLLTRAKADHPRISATFADQGFKEKAVEHAAKAGIQLIVTSNPIGSKPGFIPVHKRWVVERSFGSLMFKRRLVATTKNSHRVVKQ
jgi:hypothetical protein